MTVRFWAALAALPVICVGCSSEPGAEAPTAGSAGQQAAAGAGSGGGGAAGTAGSGGQSGSAPGGSGGVSAGAGGTAGSAGSAGSAGTGGSAGAVGGPVTPTDVAGLYTFSYGDMIFEVDATLGGRITTFSKGGTNVIDDGDGATYTGSTLWLAPEAVYGLIHEGIDTGAYTPTLDGASLVLTGPLDAPSGFSASKRFTVDSALDRVEIVYTIKNETADTPVAAWEVTRLAHSGITFYSAPTAGTDADWGALNYNYDATAQVNWIDHAAPPLAAPGKLFQDGAGWLAHAQGTLLFMKTFPDLQPSEFADPDTEIEVFANPTTAYIELENTGAITTLAAGASLTYTAQWYLRAIPGTVTVASQDQTLFDFAAAIVAE